MSYLKSRNGVDQPHKIQQELRLLHSVFQSVDVAVFIIDVDDHGAFRYHTVNPAFERLTGLAARMVVGRSITEFEDLLDKAFVERAQQYFWQCIETETPVEVEVPTHLRGETQWWLVSLTPLATGDGVPRQIIGSAFPITERKRTEEDLKVSVRQFKALFNSSLQFVGIMKPDGTVVEANRTSLEFGGLTSEQVIGKKYWDCHWWAVSPEVREQLRKSVAIAATGMFVRYNTEVLGRNGRVATIDFSIKPVRDESGRIALLIPEGRDITQRIRAEEDLRRSEALLSSVLNSSLDGVVAFRALRDDKGILRDFECLMANPMAERIMGTPEGSLKGRRILQEMGAVTGLFQQFVTVVETGEACTGEYKHIRGDQEAWLSYTAVQLADGLALTFRDITRSKEAELDLIRTNTALEQRNRELQDFAFVASHDLQEPLRKVRAFADLLQTEYMEQLDETARHYLERMADAASRMSRLISDLLTFSRIVSRAQPFQRVSLGRIVENVLSDLSVTIAGTGAEITVGELPTLEAEPSQMYQLLQNLIGNAVKFHEKGSVPRIQIQAEKTEVEMLPVSTLQEAWRMTVTDNGIGFEEKYLDRIFAPFQRLHGQREFPGTGIGLAICRRIVEYHHGTITARSRPGEGACFEVVLPVRQ